MKLLRLILLLAAFLGGYYVGHRPGSPDIFAMAKDAWQRIDRDDARAPDALADGLDRAGRPGAPSAEAGRNDPSLTEAAMAYLRDKARSQTGAAAPRPAAARDDDDLWGYTRPTPRYRR